MVNPNGGLVSSVFSYLLRLDENRGRKDIQRKVQRETLLFPAVDGK